MGFTTGISARDLKVGGIAASAQSKDGRDAAYHEGVTVDLDLSEELVARLSAEAARRGASVSQVATEVLSAHLPDSKHRLGFVGIGTSGRPGPIDIHQERANLAVQKIAEDR